MRKITDNHADGIVQNLLKSRDWRKFLYEIDDGCHRFGKYSKVPKENFIDRVAKSLSEFPGNIINNDNLDNSYVIDILKSRMKEKKIYSVRKMAEEIGINEQELYHILGNRRNVSNSVLKYLHMKREIKTHYYHLTNKAPYDSRYWKCNWITCVGGCGLSGSGGCSSNGYWWDKTCPKHVESCCQHGVGSTKICTKCNKMNIEIIRKMDKKENKSVKTISGLAK